VNREQRGKVTRGNREAVELLDDNRIDHTDMAYKKGNDLRKKRDKGAKRAYYDKGEPSTRLTR
jgi:hypothetical protein